MFTTDAGFEDEVRRIARLLWPRAEFGGAEMRDGRERDGVFETEDFVHIVECTVSRSKQKAQEDFEKLNKLIRQSEPKYAHKFCKGWFVTLNEPTAEQRSVFAKAKGRVLAVSFDQFRSKLIDARSYVTLRAKYPFGSMRDPNTGDAHPELRYVPLDISNHAGQLYSIEAIADRLSHGARLVLVGDYGAGKSATVREIHNRLAKAFWDQTTLLFPITINLRDHHGQTDPVEALERHARAIGFSRPESLVRAWRAGYVVLLLDGFDEIATAGWAGKTKKLKDLRFRSMELVRKFVRDTPASVGLIAAGRAHFFDSNAEMFGALGLVKATEILNLSEFNEEQVALFLKHQGWSHSIPSWVPSRPLLLGYLASRRLLQDALAAGEGTGPAAGWNALLDRICARESEIEAGIDANTVRRLIEHLASIARASADGLGPLLPDQMTQAFTTVCGYPPDDRGAVLLQRLPGLGGHSLEDGARVFIDADFAEAARGGAIFEFIQAPFASRLEPENWQNTLVALGAELAAIRCQDTGYGPGKLIAAIEAAQKTFRTHTVTADVLLTVRSLGYSYDGQNLFVREVIVPELALEEGTPLFGPVEFQDSVIGRLEIGPGATADVMPRFVRCYFGLVDGRAGHDDLPPDRFNDCTVEAFEDSAQTTNAILSLSLPRGSKAVLTILKKVYAQRGSGRREGALYRGLDVATQQLVPQALALLRREGLLVRAGQGEQIVWLPTKSSDARRRALSILASPTGSTDVVILESRQFE